jgi:hypothetical protein
MANLVEQVSTLLKDEMVFRWRNIQGKYPYDIKTPQNKRRKLHALDVAFKYNSVFMISPELNYFEIGNSRAEAITPHYHILEDAKIISRPYQSTAKKRGSQSSIKNKSKRDYSVVGYAQGTTTVVQEYRQQKFRNYFGQGTEKTTPREYIKRQKVTNKNKRNYYYNKYFGYIENLVDEASRFVSAMIGATLKVEKDSTIAVADIRPNLGRITNGNL